MIHLIIAIPFARTRCLSPIAGAVGPDKCADVATLHARRLRMKDLCEGASSFSEMRAPVTAIPASLPVEILEASASAFLSRHRFSESRPSKLSMGPASMFEIDRLQRL